MMIIFAGSRADFLSYQKLLTAMFLQKKSMMQASQYVNGIYIVKIVCDCFLP